MHLLAVVAGTRAVVSISSNVHKISLTTSSSITIDIQMFYTAQFVTGLTFPNLMEHSV